MTEARPAVPLQHSQPQHPKVTTARSPEHSPDKRRPANSPPPRTVVQHQQEKLVSKLPAEKQLHIRQELDTKKAKQRTTRAPHAIQNTSGTASGKLKLVSNNDNKAGKVYEQRRSHLSRLEHNPDAEVSRVARDAVVSVPLSREGRRLLQRIAMNPKADPRDRRAAIVALMHDQAVKDCLRGVMCRFGSEARLRTIVMGGITRADVFGVTGIRQGVAEIIDASAAAFASVSVAMDASREGYAVFQPVEDVAPDDTEPFDPSPYRGIYYSVEDPLGAMQDQIVSGVDDVTPDQQRDFVEGCPVTPTTMVYYTRYLRIANGTDERVTVHLRYRTQEDTGAWIWLPTGKAEGRNEVLFELEPGQSGDAYDGDWRIQASRVRIWATSESGKVWDTHKSADLVLIPMNPDNGMASYVAGEIGIVKWMVK